MEGPAAGPSAPAPEPFGPAPAEAGEGHPGQRGPAPVAPASSPQPTSAPVPGAPGSPPPVAAGATPVNATPAAAAPGVSAVATARGPAPAAGASAAPIERPAGPRPTHPAGAARAAEELARPEAAPEPDRAETILQQLRLRLQVDGTARQAWLQLMPAELGHVSIRLALADGRVSALVRAESKETLAILERHVPELRAALAQHGLEAESFELELASPDPRDGSGAGPRTGEEPEERGLSLSAIGRRQGAHSDELRGALPPHLIHTLNAGVDTYA